MTVSFDEIPKNWRVPLVWCEISPSPNNSAAAMPFKVLVMGHAKTGLTANEPRRISSADQAAKVFGPDSLLAAQAAAYFKGNTVTETYFVPVTEPSGSAASITLTFGGLTEGGGVIYLYVGRRRFSAYVNPEAEGRDAAEALYAAMVDGPWAVSLGAGADPTLTITAPHKGSYANGVMVRPGYYPDEEMPEGLTLSFSGSTPDNGSPTPDYEISAALAGLVAYYGEMDPARPFQSLLIRGMLQPKSGAFGRLAGGTGVPDLTGLIAALGDTQFNIMATPWVDSATLAVLKEMAADRWKALNEIPTQIIGAAGGSHSALGLLGDSHNSPHLTIMGTGGPFTAEENNLLLFDGISTYAVDADGGCTVQRLITTYKTGAFGAEDQSYLDLNTPLTLSYLRRSYKIWMAQRFPRHKLCNDDTNFGFGQAMVTPKMIKGETVAWFDAMERLGLVEDVDTFKKELIVERNADDPCRVDIYLPPDLVNQLRVMAVKMAFKL